MNSFGLAAACLVLAIVTPIVGGVLRRKTVVSKEDSRWAPIYCVALLFVALAIGFGTHAFFGPH